MSLQTIPTKMQYEQKENLFESIPEKASLKHLKTESVKSMSNYSWEDFRGLF